VAPIKDGRFRREKSIKIVLRRSGAASAIGMGVNLTQILGDSADMGGAEKY